MALALALYLVSAAAASSIRSAGDAVGRSLAKQAEVHKALGDALLQEHQFTVNSIREWLNTNHELMVAGFLRQRGLAPYMADPEGRILADIEAVQSHLGCTRLEAVAYIRQSIQLPPEARPPAGEDSNPS